MRGIAVVEMALVLVPLVLLTFGMTELGRAFVYYDTVVKSTRDAARYLSMQSPGMGEAQARCLAVFGNMNCSGTELAPGLTTQMVEITYARAVQTGYGSLDVVQVSITGYPFASAVPLAVPDLLFGPISTSMRQAAS